VLSEVRRDHFGLGRRGLIVVVAGDQPERAKRKQRKQQCKPGPPMGGLRYSCDIAYACSPTDARPSSLLA
jgi:hypothetical protein